PQDQTFWERLTMSPERRAGRTLQAIVDEPIEQARRRLRVALDLPRRQEYLRALEANRREVDRWHDFHVYNWPPPAPRIDRLVCYDAADLTRGDSGLRALEDLRPGFTVLTADALVSAAE